MRTDRTRQVEVVVRIAGRPIQYSFLDFSSAIFGQRLVLHVSDKADVTTGDRVELSWKSEQDGKVFSTLAVDTMVYDLCGTMRLVCHEPYGKALGKVIPAASWRKAKLEEITKDIISIAGIDRYDLSALPSTTLARFSYAGQCAGWVLQSLRHAVADHLGIHLVLVPDLSGQLRIGRCSDLVPDAGLSLSFASSRDVVDHTDDAIHLHVYPLLYGQTMDIDGVPFFIDSVSMRIKAGASATWVKVREL